MVDSDLSDEMMDYPSFECNACIPLFFCFLFENQLFSLIQVNIIFSLTITDNNFQTSREANSKVKINRYHLTHMLTLETLG